MTPLNTAPRPSIRSGSQPSAETTAASGRRGLPAVGASGSNAAAACSRAENLAVQPLSVVECTVDTADELAHILPVLRNIGDTRVADLGAVDEREEVVVEG